MAIQRARSGDTEFADITIWQIAELRNAGFTLAKRLDILPYQYYPFFDKR